MKNFIFLLSLMLQNISSYCQQVAISADKNNVCYLGTDNPLTIVAEDCSCHQLIIKVDNGKIKGKSCQYIYNPDHIGKVRISALKRSGRKLIILSEYEFRVKKVPDPSFSIGPIAGKSGDVNAALLNSYRYATAHLENFDYDVRFIVDSFRVVIISEDTSLLKTFMNYGSTINEEIGSAFSNLKVGDKVSFDSIKVHCADMMARELPSFNLKVTRAGGKLIIIDRHDD